MKHCFGAREEVQLAGQEKQGEISTRVGTGHFWGSSQQQKRRVADTAVYLLKLIAWRMTDEDCKCIFMARGKALCWLGTQTSLGNGLIWFSVYRDALGTLSDLRRHSVLRENHWLRRTLPSLFFFYEESQSRKKLTAQLSSFPSRGLQIFFWAFQQGLAKPLPLPLNILGKQTNPLFNLAIISALNSLPKATRAEANFAKPSEKFIPDPGELICGGKSCLVTRAHLSIPSNDH